MLNSNTMIRLVMFLSAVILLTTTACSVALPQKSRVGLDDVTVDPNSSPPDGPRPRPGVDLPDTTSNKVRQPVGVRDSPNDSSEPRLRVGESVRPSSGPDPSSLGPRPGAQPPATDEASLGRGGADGSDRSDLGTGGRGTSGENGQSGTGNVRQSEPRTDSGVPSNKRPRRQAGAPGQAAPGQPAPGQSEPGQTAPGQPTPFNERPNPEFRIPLNGRPVSDRNPALIGNGQSGPRLENPGPGSINVNQKPATTGRPALSSLPCLVRDGSNQETRKKSCAPDSSCSIGPLSILLNGSNVNVFYCRTDEHLLMSLACRLDGVPSNAIRLHQCSAGDTCSVGPLVIELPFGQTRIQAFFCKDESVEQQRRPNLITPS